MPQPYGQAVITDKGEELLAKSSAGQCLIEYVCMVVGNGMYTAEEKRHTELKRRTGLKGEKNRYSFSAATLESNAVRLTALLTNQDPVTAEGLVTEGYYINEVGIYAKEKGTDNSTAILYSICLTSSDTGMGDYMPAYTGHNRAEITQDYIIHIGDNTNISVNMVGAVALAEDVNRYKDEMSHHILNKNNPHKVTKDHIGLGEANNTSDMDKPVSTAQQAAIDAAYQQSTAYADLIVNALINGAPGDLDTIGELAQAMENNKDVVAILRAAIGSKADQAELEGHTGNSTIHVTATERKNWNDANSKKHNHSNKSVLDAITDTIVEAWNSAVTHISDSVKHITAAERKKWNEGSVNMTAATASAAGEAGLVPAPAAGAQIKYLRGDGTFENVDDHTVTFTSGDAENPTGWADIVLMTTGEKLSSFARKCSLGLKNLRYLKKLIGSTDMSGLGDGTITGAIHSLNTDLTKRLGGYRVEFNIAKSNPTMLTTMSNLFMELSAPCMFLCSTENITDKPAGKYGTILIFKYSNTRAAAICICTDGTLLANAWNASTSTVTGWK